MWIEKYRVTEFDSFFGNEKPRLIIVNWLKKWIKGTKPLLIIGPPGTGKTSFVKSLAKLLDFDLVELNASDLRNKINLEAIINPILQNNSVFGKQMLLFLDEVDGMSGRDDYGGLPFLYLRPLLSEHRHSLICWIKTVIRHNHLYRRYHLLRLKTIAFAFQRYYCLVGSD